MAEETEQNVQTELEKEKKKGGVGKKIIFGIIGVVVFLIIIGVAGGGDKKIQTSNSSGGDQKQELSKSEEVKETFKIGDKVQRGDAVLTVNKINEDWESTNQFDKPQSSDDEFIVVNITLQNQGKGDMSLIGFYDFKLEDSDGVQRSEAIAAGIGLNKLSGQSVTSLSPGGKITGDLLFAVPKKATTKLTLHYKPLISFGKPAEIELK